MQKLFPFKNGAGGFMPARSPISAVSAFAAVLMLGIPAALSAQSGTAADTASAGSSAAGSVAATAAMLPASSSTPSSLEEGERLFRENRPKEAAAALEKAVLVPGVDERAWLYLAASYEEQKRYADAVAALRRGLPQAQSYRHLFYFDMGNLFALQGKSSFAEEMYGKAIEADASYAYSYLNRANARMSLKNYEGAGEDYRTYLEKDPASPQRETIEKVLALMQNDIVAAQQAAAAAAAQAEAEAEAKAALLAQVEASLKEAAEQTQSLSAGPGDAQGYDDESELE